MKMKPNKKVDEFLNPLQSLTKVDPPPFLLTKIQAKLERERKEVMPIKYVWTLGLSFLLILLLNLMTVRFNYSTKHKSADLIESLQLETHNDLY